MKSFFMRARGNSMYPLLQDGDYIEYIYSPFKNIRLSDLILVYADDILMTHRVIYKKSTSCITRGDNNPTADTLVQKGRVLAKVIRFRRKGAWHNIQDVYLTQSIIYLQEIQKLEILLRINKLPHVFLKGVLVSLLYEGSIPKRIYADCDILIKRNDARKIEYVFKHLGYKLLGRTPLFNKANIQSNQPEVSFMKMVGRTPVVFDVHFEPVFLMTQLGGMGLLFPKDKLLELGESIISNGKCATIQGFSYTVCSAADQILYLALHIFHHNFTDSIRYQLLDAVIRKSASKKTWKHISDSIRKYRLEGYTYLVFALLKQYFHTPIPFSFFSSIEPQKTKKIVLSRCMKHVDIFNRDTRMKAGIERFILIFLLSPEPVWKKTLLFFHKDTIKSVVNVVFTKTISFAKRKRV